MPVKNKEKVLRQGLYRSPQYFVKISNGTVVACYPDNGSQTTTTMQKEFSTMNEAQNFIKAKTSQEAQRCLESKNDGI